jgi:hypothetical protein
MCTPWHTSLGRLNPHRARCPGTASLAAMAVLDRIELRPGPQRYLRCPVADA